MKSASVLIMFALLLTACVSASGHRLVSKEEYYAGMPRYYTTYQYEEGELAAKTTVYYYKDFNSDDHIDTVYYTYQTKKVGDNIEEIKYTTEIRKDRVNKYKSVSSSDGTYSEFTLEGDEWVKWDMYSNDDASGITFDSVTYSSDSLQVTHVEIYRRADAPDTIISKRIDIFDVKGRKISEERFDPDETDDEHPNLSRYTYRYTGRRMKAILRAKLYKNGEYREEIRHKHRIVYNRRGLEKKMVGYDMNNGKKRSVSRTKWKYDRKTGDPLRQTRYSTYGYGVAWFRKPLYETIWTYAK